MTKLEKLREYLNQEIGDLVTVIYDRASERYCKDRIRIRYEGCWVCSIYDGRAVNYDLFDIVFYVPFTCKSEGCLTNLTDISVAEIPRVIKKRIDICNNIKINITYDGKTAAEMVKNDLDKIYMYSARCNGKTKIVSDLLKNKTVVYNGNIHTNIENVIFNDPATIVFWTDGSKTVVKCQSGETFDPEKGLAMAISKKVLGNDYGYYETFAKYVGRYNKKRGKKNGSDRKTT